MGKNILQKQRYEYYKGTQEIFDNELDSFVDDVVDRLNMQHYNKKDLLEVKQNQDQQIAELQEKVKKLEYDNGELTSLIDAMRYEDPKIDELQKQLEASETQNKRVLEKLELITKSNQDLEKQLEGKEKEIEHWHKLYQERDRQFQSVRQRYHLLNELQSNYDKKDKLQLLEMQCLELVNENEQLKKENGYIVFSDGYDKNGNEIHRQEFVKYKDKFKELVEENKKLKQSQKKLTIKELGALAKFCEINAYYYEEEQFAKQINKWVNEKIKKLKGE